MNTVLGRRSVIFSDVVLTAVPGDLEVMRLTLITVCGDSEYTRRTVASE